MLALAAAEHARAFSTPSKYIDDVDNGGGGGRWFTGSPAAGYGCSVCHTGGAPERLYISGLPTQGYVPGQTYEIALTWPDFAAREQASRETPGVTPAVMSVVAELVSESGRGAGTLELIGPEEVMPGELCHFPPDKRAVELYGVRPGEEASELNMRCQASGLGERCILALLSCGAQALRFRWTPPSEWEGPIWFAAGMVATDAMSGSAEFDAVREELIPLLPAVVEDGQYEQVIEPGCSAAGASRFPLSALTGLLPLVFLYARAFSSRGRRRKERCR